MQEQRRRKHRRRRWWWIAHDDFNGTAHSGSLLATATLQNNNAGGNELGLEAADSAGHILAISVGPANPESTIAVGTYMTAVSEPFAAFQYTDGSNGTGTWAAGGNANLTGSGEVTITVLTSTEIKGTFASTLTGSGNDPGSGTAAITNGVFDLPL